MTTLLPAISLRRLPKSRVVRAGIRMAGACMTTAAALTALALGTVSIAAAGVEPPPVPPEPPAATPASPVPSATPLPNSQRALISSLKPVKPVKPMDEGLKRRIRIQLQQAIDIELKQASIRQMAETIRISTGLPLRVDDRVPTDTKVTVAAHSVPVSEILEAVSRQSNLRIDMDNQGVVLTRPAFLHVGGGKSGEGEDRGETVWSADWDVPPTATGGIRYRPGINKIAGGSFSLNSRFNSNSASSSGISVVTLGNNRLVVIEPGNGSDGRPGVWMTVYRVEEDGTVRRQGAMFHPASETGPRGPGGSRGHQK